MFVADYLDYVCKIKGIEVNKVASEIKRVIRATDIESKILSPISTLSRGYKQRVGIAQAILGKPKLLILDEPTNGLDPKQTNLVRELIRDLSKNATVILSTHIMQEVDALCDRYVSEAPSVLQRDFRASLMAAFTVVEVCDQLELAGLSQFMVKEIGDRYLEISGRW